MALSRRTFLRATYATAGLATLATVGETLSPLRRVSVLAPRVPTVGPQGFPVNRLAKDAKVTEELVADYHLTVDGPTPLLLSLADLQALPQHRVKLPIACVEGWSAMAEWTGVRVRDLLDMAGVPHSTRISVESLEAKGTYRTSVLDRNHARASSTLLAMKVHGEVLALDHGYPVRLISADRPGVLQTKWVGKLTSA